MGGCDIAVMLGISSRSGVPPRAAAGARRSVASNRPRWPPPWRRAVRHLLTYNLCPDRHRAHGGAAQPRFGAPCLLRCAGWGLTRGGPPSLRRVQHNYSAHLTLHIRCVSSAPAEHPTGTPQRRSCDVIDAASQRIAGFFGRRSRTAGDQSRIATAAATPTGIRWVCRGAVRA